ncbi:MAG: hypothetical protein NPINA01_05260 [Nitrospinaceae bacterium]|nr:MAG: hypothetical protein NPINA01_05260 [Nitrospinaceae bacterium]
MLGPSNAIDSIVYLDLNLYAIAHTIKYLLQKEPFKFKNIKKLTTNTPFMDSEIFFNSIERKDFMGVKKRLGVKYCVLVGWGHGEADKKMLLRICKGAANLYLND